NGSRRIAACPTAAAVASEPMVAARYTPCDQLNAWYTSGWSLDMRPPKMNADSGTPLGSSQSGSTEGHCDTGAVKRELGCAAGVLLSGVQSFPRQSMRWLGGSLVRPSHHTSPSSVSATLVKMQLACSVAIALGLVSSPVPGATPKNPASGLIA